VEDFLRGLLAYIGPYHAIEGEEPPDEWRKLVLHFEDTSSSDPNDDVNVSFDIVNITNGDIDSSWTDSDMSTVEQVFDDAIVNAGLTFPSRLRFGEFKWYRRAFNPYPVDPVVGTPDKPFMDSGPPIRITTLSHLGDGATVPPQLSLVVSERTAWPHHHGRVYWPMSGGSAIDGTGHATTSFVDGVASIFAGLYASLADREYQIAVPVTQVKNTPARALIGVSEIWVDNVIDTQRRRAFETATYTKKLPAA